MSAAIPNLIAMSQRLSVEIDKLPHSQNKEALRSLSKKISKWISLLRSTPEPKKPEKEEVAEEAQDDSWVGKAITDARMAYETWTALLRREIKVDPEYAPNLLGGGYGNLFTNYAKVQFLSAVAVLHRGFFVKEQGKTMYGKSEVARRMEEALSAEEDKKKIGDFLRSGQPFRDFRNFDQHRENPHHPQVWTVQINQPRPTIGTPKHGFVDPFPVYEQLKALEPTIGYAAFVIEAARSARED